MSALVPAGALSDALANLRPRRAGVYYCVQTCQRPLRGAESPAASRPDATREHCSRGRGLPARDWDISHGLSVAPFMSNEAVEMNHSANAVHFDGLHARISVEGADDAVGAHTRITAHCPERLQGGRRKWSTATKKFEQR